MIGKLAEAIVEAFCKKMGLNTADDLAAFLAKTARDEFPELAKLDTFPTVIAANVSTQLTAIVTAAINAALAPITSAINRFNPFGRSS